MHITYDPEVDALYIRFEEATVTTKKLDDGIAADYDAKGKLAGIEILDCLKRFGDRATFKKVTLEEIGLGA
ncbi:DUF2283 domain-containing protein [Candidatus Aerophobetes bacterium]|nr:DUF2283 domain-containing protein [Candidatus Aerophobetes bacterium]